MYESDELRPVYQDIRQTLSFSHIPFPSKNEAIVNKNENS